MFWTERLDHLHCLATLWAAKILSRWRSIRLVNVRSFGGVTDIEQLSGQMQPVAVAGTEESIIAHFDETFGQDVLQKTTDELLGGHSAIPGLACVRGCVAKGDLLIL